MAAIRTASIASPKRKLRDQNAWYDYYAGYSAEFAHDVLTLLAPSGDSALCVLDPWNGSGTTSAVAAKSGHATVGVDRNPALVTIAKGRHLAISSVEKSLHPLTSDILAIAKTLVRKVRAETSEEDELRQWFTATGAARLRSVERAIQRLLVDSDAPEVPREPVDSASLSPLASFFYCALFTITRRLTASFRTTNPTWVRSARTKDEYVEVSWTRIATILEEAISTLKGRLKIPSPPSASCSLYEGSVEDLSLGEPADIVLSSPPYCTRIDYVIATKPELAVMAHDASDLKRLRQQMLGTPLTAGIEPTSKPEWGAKATTFLTRVESHSSKAAATYYLRYFAAYMHGLFTSLEAIDRNTRPEGPIALVVQDSYFKEVHCDLPGIVTEMGNSLGRPSDRHDFPVARTKAAIHPGSREYRTTFTATESLLVLEPKEG